MSPWSHARCFLRGCVDIDCSLREHASTLEYLPALSINRRRRPAEREPVASNREFTRFEYSKDVYESDRLIMSTLFDDALVPLSASFMGNTCHIRLRAQSWDRSQFQRSKDRCTRLYSQLCKRAVRHPNPRY